MTKIKNEFVLNNDINKLDIKRLFTTQQLMLKELEFYMFKEYNKNSAFESLQNIYVINEYIRKQLSYEKK